MLKLKRMERIIKTYQATNLNENGITFVFQNNTVRKTFLIAKETYTDFWKECSLLDEKVLAGFILEEKPEERRSLHISYNFGFTSEVSPALLDMIQERLFKLSVDAYESVYICEEDDIIGACVQTNPGELFFVFPTLGITENGFTRNVLPEINRRLPGLFNRSDLPDFPKRWEDITGLTALNVYGTRYDNTKTVPRILSVRSRDEGVCFDPLTFYINPTEHHLVHSDDDSLAEQVMLSMSINYTNVLPKPKVGVKEGSVKDITSSYNVDSENLELLFPLISTDRLNDPVYGDQICRTVYNIYNGSCEWIDFLKPYYSESHLKSLEETFHQNFEGDRYLSIRTIGHFARIDNFDLYEEWKLNWVREAFNVTIDNGLEVDIAEVMYRMHWLDFITVDKNIWYYFDQDQNRLILCESDTRFKKRIDDLINYYRLNYAECSKREDDSSKKVHRIINRIGQGSFQTTLLKLCCTKFYREDVSRYFNSNPWIIVWNNCVTQVHEEKIIVRPGKMEDFVTMKSDVSYYPDRYQMNHPEVIQVMDWMKTLFVEDDMIEYFLKICSSLLIGRNVEHNCYIFTGSGSNGKSVINTMIQKIFCQYASIFPTSALTDDKQLAGRACPEIAQAKHARFVSVTEPEEGMNLMAGLIKRYNGEDVTFVRKNYENGGNMDIMFKMVISCNTIPPIQGADDAIYRRLIVVPFMSKYTDEAPDDVEEQFRQRRFPLDRHFKKTIDSLRQAMLWLIISYYPKYFREGLSTPKLVKEYTDDYWANSDPYRVYIQENLVKTGVATNRIRKTELFKRFKAWYGFNYGRKKNVDITTAIKHFSSDQLLGSPVNHIWSGYTFVEDEVTNIG